MQSSWVMSMPGCSCREPDLVPLTNYALGAVLDAARLTGPDPLPDYSFVDGQPIDLKAVFTNESEPAAVCLVKDNVEAVHQGDDVYAIQVSPLLRSCIARLVDICKPGTQSSPCNVGRADSDSVPDLCGVISRLLTEGPAEEIFNDHPHRACACERSTCLYRRSSGPCPHIEYPRA